MKQLLIMMLVFVPAVPAVAQQPVRVEFPTQCGPGGCSPGWGSCQPQYYQPRQQGPQPDGNFTPPVGSQGTPQFQPCLPSPPPLPTPPGVQNPPQQGPPGPAGPQGPQGIPGCNANCECGPKWLEINAQLEKIRNEMTASQTAVSNLTTIVGELSKRPAPTMDEIEAEMKKRLTHSATITLLDGTKKEQTVPLNQPLRFNQHQRSPLTK